MCMFWNYQVKLHDFKDFLFILFILHVFTQLFFSWKLLVTNDPVEESGVFARHVDIVFYENDTASTEGDSVFLYENDSSEQCPTCDDFNDGSVFMNLFINQTSLVVLSCCTKNFRSLLTRWLMLTSDISRLFTLCHILYNIGIVYIRWNQLIAY